MLGWPKSDTRFFALVGVVGLLVAFSTAWMNYTVLIPMLPLGEYNPPEPIKMGYVADWKGLVYRVRGANRDSLDELAEDHRVELEDGDKIETTTASEALVKLTSQDEIAVTAFSIVGFEAWNEDDPSSPIYIHVFLGNIVSKQAGIRGRSYVVRLGKLFTPQMQAGAKVPPTIITRGQLTDLGLRETAPSLGTGELLGPGKTVEELDGHPSIHLLADPETLSNEYVQELIHSRQMQLQKCWLSRLKDKPMLKGKLTVQFEITRRGKVRDLKIADSTLGDEQLGQCVMTVIERLPFRMFRGPEIAIAYPITFE